MAKDNLETRAKKAILKIEKKVSDIVNVIYDLSMKFCHIIKYKFDYNLASEKADNYNNP